MTERNLHRELAAMKMRADDLARTLAELERECERLRGELEEASDIVAVCEAIEAMPPMQVVASTEKEREELLSLFRGMGRLLEIRRDRLARLAARPEQTKGEGET